MITLTFLSIEKSTVKWLVLVTVPCHSISVFKYFLFRLVFLVMNNV